MIAHDASWREQRVFARSTGCPPWAIVPCRNSVLMLARPVFVHCRACESHLHQIGAQHGMPQMRIVFG